LPFTTHPAILKTDPGLIDRRRRWCIHRPRRRWCGEGACEYAPKNYTDGKADQSVIIVVVMVLVTIMVPVAFIVPVALMVIFVPVGIPIVRRMVIFSTGHGRGNGTD